MDHFAVQVIGGFYQRQGEAQPPQISIVNLSGTKRSTSRKHQERSFRVVTMLENCFATGAPPQRTLLGKLTVLAGGKKGSLPLPKNTTSTLDPLGLGLSKAFNITEVSEKVISSTYNARTL